MTDELQSFSMLLRMFRLDPRLRHLLQSRLRSALEPRKPRHRLLRAACGIVGLAVLALLVMFGLVVGAAMLTAGLGWRVWKRRRQPPAHAPRILRGQYRVVRKPVLGRVLS